MDNVKNNKIKFTPKMTVLYIIFSVITVASMLFGWLSVDLNFGFVQLGNVLGDITVFNLPDGIRDVISAVGALAGLISGDFLDGLNTAYFYSVVIMILGITAIVLYGVSVVLYIMRKTITKTICLIAGACAFVTPIGFAALIGYVLSIFDAAGSLMDILTLPWWLTISFAVVSLFFVPTKEVRIVRVYTGMYNKRIEDYPHDPSTEWVCSSCNRVNKHETNFCECGCGVALE